MLPGTAARQAAFEILQRVRRGQPFDAAHEVAAHSLPDQDKRLAYEIAAGVLRRRTELDGRVRSHVVRSWERTPEDLKDLLRIGVYQLTRLERVPPYAAVQTTVEVAKRASGSRGASLVNAVLRRATASNQVVPDGGSSQDGLAAQHSHPAWLVERWIRQFGERRTAALLEHNNRRPPLVIQPVGWSGDRLAAVLAERDIPFAAAPTGPGLRIERGRAEELPGYAEGAFVVQDAGQARLVGLARVPDGSTVWDACASPGGKAAVLSRRCQVLASDMRRRRLPRLRQTLARVAPHVPVVLADARHPPFDTARIDATLLDVPCTGTGTLARHPDGRWRLSQRQIDRLASRQADILWGAAESVRRGALLLYLTCSLEPEENQDQVNRFLSHFPNFERTQDDVFLFPPDTGTDGGFAARLRRVK